MRSLSLTLLAQVGTYARGVLQVRYPIWPRYGNFLEHVSDDRHLTVATLEEHPFVMVENVDPGTGTCVRNTVPCRRQSNYTDRYTWQHKHTHSLINTLMSANTWSQMFIPQQCLMKCSAVDLNRWKLCNSSDTVLVALFQYAFTTKPLKQWSWPVKRGQHISAYIHKIQNKWSSFMFFGYSRTCQ